ncbi:hypothetical protein AURDEDRAFT_115762 [Auricularia subglabra TFB-10046 SS5]|uniref:COQ9 C-terminal domain-containing protein n=1 Tax=Auricularia subglabra (strain TFB-10046 / SS5) TaxID=717982 RepID=J0LJU8_AURST|nr:hypothetical protein AURDEDRAFT_115762 [Auricularia subglabra TFB-10046 SS5]
MTTPTQLLRAALPHIHTHGFTCAALAEGQQLSGTALGALFGPADGPERALFEEWLTAGLEDMRLAEASTSKRAVLKASLVRRLEWNAPVLHHLPFAIKAWSSMPGAAVGSLKLPSAPSPRPVLHHALSVADEALIVAGDESRGPEWYARRAVVGAIYGLAESHQLRSTSIHDRSAQSLLSRMLDEADRARAAKEEAGIFAEYLWRSVAGIARSTGAFVR